MKLIIQIQPNPRTNHFFLTNLVLKGRSSACRNSCWVRVDDFPSFNLLEFFGWFVSYWSFFAFKLKCKLLQHLGELFVADSLIEVSILCLNVLVGMDLLFLDNIMSGALRLNFTFRLRELCSFFIWYSYTCASFSCFMLLHWLGPFSETTMKKRC